MRRYVLAFLAVIVAAAGYLAYPATAGTPLPDLASYSVKLNTPTGHGSGTHIGGGYILTAAHVVAGRTSVVVQTNIGRQRYAKVLWINTETDLALLLTSPQGMASANLSCRTAHAGEPIRADGNPLNIDFVSSSGKISGDAREIASGRLAYVTDMTTVMGMSGGGTFDRNGDLIGITSAVAIAPLQTGPAAWTPSLTGFGMAVPSFVACRLMGRGV
jgi:serine protease Do